MTGVQTCALPIYIPLLVVVNNQSENESHFGFMSSDLKLTIIEEPELNCFPLLQNSILKYMVVCANPPFPHAINSEGYMRRIVVTTHSPYILAALNNLMYAHEIGQENKEDVEALGIPSKYWVNPNDVGTYLLKDGYAENIIDEELKQIKVEKIDEVSEELSKQWHQLADLKFEKQG